MDKDLSCSAAASAAKTLYLECGLAEPNILFVRSRRDMDTAGWSFRPQPEMLVSLFVAVFWCVSAFCAMSLVWSHMSHFNWHNLSLGQMVWISILLPSSLGFLFMAAKMVRNLVGCLVSRQRLGFGAVNQKFLFEGVAKTPLAITEAIKNALPAAAFTSFPSADVGRMDESRRYEDQCLRLGRSPSPHISINGLACLQHAVTLTTSTPIPMQNAILRAAVELHSLADESILLDGMVVIMLNAATD